MKKIMITGINSGIGLALAMELLSAGRYQLYGTYRKPNEMVTKLEKLKVIMFRVDFSCPESIDTWLTEITPASFDCFYFIHGSLTPIGKLGDIKMSDWHTANFVNFQSIVQVLNHCLAELQSGCRVITLAGGGVNGAPKCFSAYTSAKVSLVKLAELCAAEYPELLFFNIGPGWVDTPIHQQTLIAKATAGDAYQVTLDRYDSGDFIDMNDVISALIFFLDEATYEFSGRNYSVASDNFDITIRSKLNGDENLFKLRRRQ